MFEFFSSSRTAFEEAFVSEIQDGSLIIIGWTQDESTRLSHGFLTVGRKDTLETEKLIEKVQAHVTPQGAYQDGGHNAH